MYITLTLNDSWPEWDLLLCLCRGVSFLVRLSHPFFTSSPSFSAHKSAGSFVPLARAHRLSRPGLVLVHPLLSAPLSHVKSCAAWWCLQETDSVFFAPLNTLHKLTRQGAVLTVHNSIRLKPLHSVLLESASVFRAMGNWLQSGFAARAEVSYCDYRCSHTLLRSVDCLWAVVCCVKFPSWPSVITM